MQSYYDTKLKYCQCYNSQDVMSSQSHRRQYIRVNTCDICNNINQHLRSTVQHNLLMIQISLQRKVPFRVMNCRSLLTPTFWSVKCICNFTCRYFHIKQKAQLMFWTNWQHLQLKTLVNQHCVLSKNYIFIEFTYKVTNV